MTIVVLRSFTIGKGTFTEFERLSREEVWPYMEARGCKILGLFQNLHGGPSDEVLTLTAYDSLAHWESTRLNVPPPAGSSPEVVELARKATEAGQERNKFTRVSSTRVMRLVTPWVDYGVKPL